MKQRLIVLSDLWGREKSSWLEFYTACLEDDFKVKYYDCCELGAVDKSEYTQNKLHEGFINGGIDRAVEKLQQLEQNKINILAFSVGGAIAWKFGLKSDNLDSLYCISSTRLRHETSKPSGKIKLFFGEHDNHKPTNSWFEKLSIDYSIIQSKKHEMYTDAKIAKNITSQIITSVSNAQ